MWQFCVRKLRSAAHPTPDNYRKRNAEWNRTTTGLNGRTEHREHKIRKCKKTRLNVNLRHINRRHLVSEANGTYKLGIDWHRNVAQSVRESSGVDDTTIVSVVHTPIIMKFIRSPLATFYVSFNTVAHTHFTALHLSTRRLVLLSLSPPSSPVNKVKTMRKKYVEKKEEKKHSRTVPVNGHRHSRRWASYCSSRFVWVNSCFYCDFSSFQFLCRIYRVCERESCRLLVAASLRSQSSSHE